VEGRGHAPDTLVADIKRRDPALLEAKYGKGAVEVVVSGLRHAICAGPGSRLLSGDYSGIQARVVLALAGEHEKTAMMAAGQDIYCDMATRLYKRPIDRELDPKERGIGKAAVLGLGFQLGPATFMTKMARDQTLEFCQEVVRVYRKEWAPGVPRLWYDLQDAAVDTVWYGRPHEAHGIVYRLEDEWLTAEIPNGRGSKLWYKSPRQTRRAMPWDENDVRRGFAYQVQKKGQWVTRDAFGGQLTENVVMKIEREIMEDAKRRLKRYGYPLVLEVHDECIAELPQGKGSLDEYQRILEDVDRWTTNMQIPIQVDCWEGSRYRK
jgi:DNA polymerase